MLCLSALLLVGCSRASQQTSEPQPTATTATTAPAVVGDPAEPPGVAVEEPELEDELDILRLLLRNDPAEAEKIRSRREALLSRKDVMGYYANLYTATLAESKNEPAARYYETALALSDTETVRRKWVDALLQEGPSETALVAMAPLLPDPAVLEAVLALPVAPDLIAQTLMDRSLWQEAEAWLSQFLSDASGMDPQAADRMLRMRAVCLARAGRYQDALPLLAQALATVNGATAATAAGEATLDDVVAGEAMLDATAASEVPPVAGVVVHEITREELLFLQARSFEATGDMTQAKTIYKALGAMGAERLGLMLEAENQPREAALALIASNKPPVVWRGLQIAEEQNMTATMLEAYLRLAQDTSEAAAPYRDDAAYRAFVLERRLGQPNNEAKLLAVLSDHPSWMVRLGRAPVWPSFETLTPEYPLFLTAMERYETGGYADIAALEYIMGIRETTVAQKFGLAIWNAAREDIYRSSIWADRTLAEVKAEQAYALAYPRLFEDEVRKAAEEFQLEPALLWAVMRQESRFQPQVLSRVGAVGLMQIMPATGKDIASRLKVAEAEIILTDPEMNIRFGAFYLRSMLDQHDGNTDMALASYNGGGGNVRRWRNSAIMTGAEDFPTAITFFETREYITKVMDNYHTYKWLYE